MGSVSCSISDAERRAQKKKTQTIQRRNVVLEVRAMRKQYEKLFFAYDRDGDGMLDKTEWELFYRDLLMSRGMSKKRAEAFMARPYLNQGRQSHAEFDAYQKPRISFEEFWGHTHTKSRLLPFTLDQLNAAKAYLSSWVPEQPPKKKLIVSVGSRSNLFREESASRLPGVRKESKESAASAAAAAAPVPVQPVVMTKPQPHLHRGASNSALKNTVGPGGVPVEVGQHIESSIAEVQNKLEQERGRQGNKSNDREDDGDEDFEDFHTLSRVEAQSMHDEIEKEILDAWNEESQ